MSSQFSIALLTPPFVQLSSPYPATAFLKGYLATQEINARQYDFGLEIFHELFNGEAISNLRDNIFNAENMRSPCLQEFLAKSSFYINTIDQVINFLQNKNNSLARRILTRQFLPEGKRFESLEQYLGETSTFDYALHLASLYIDDLTDVYQQSILPEFSLSSYSAHLIQSGQTFDNIKPHIRENTFFLQLMQQLIEKHQLAHNNLVGITIPFPGNLIPSLMLAYLLKKANPNITIVAGGGFVNTDLRMLQEPQLFDYFDYVVYDDGELPLLRIIQKMQGQSIELINTAFRNNNSVALPEFLPHPKLTYKPDYQGLPLDKYITLRESTNEMHALWSERLYLKLQAAHGCYHHQCAFCDTALPYIADYYPHSVEAIINYVESLMEETGIHSFHFIDEALPPAFARRFSEALLRKGINITWWGNIRFDSAFTAGLAKLMSLSGCIAVSGGIESCDDEILTLMNKKSSATQIIDVLNNFSKAGILVHGYLIYAFPKEKPLNIINSLEIIRQLFAEGLLNSAFYHRFSLTIHSPIFKNPHSFGIQLREPSYSTWSNNDVDYKDATSATCDLFGTGLETAMYNFNHANALDLPITSWFKELPTHLVPAPTISHNFVHTQINKAKSYSKSKNIIWTGVHELDNQLTEDEEIRITFANAHNHFQYDLPAQLASKLDKLLTSSQISCRKFLPLEKWARELQDYFPAIEDLTTHELWHDLVLAGLIQI